MTISTTSNQIAYTGDAVTLAFSFPYPFITTNDLKVYVNGTQVLTGFAVAGTIPTGGSGTFSSGTVTFVAAPAALATVLIYSDPDQLQSTGLPPNDPFPSKTVEKMVDKVTLLIQAIYRKFGNALTYPPGDLASGVLPDAATRANKLVSFDALGNATTVAPSAGSATALAIQLADTTIAANGAGLSGFNYSLGYAAGTIGKWLKDLALSTGAAFIGWIQAGTGAVLRTIQDKLRDQVSAFDYMTAAEIADVKAGAVTLSVSAKVQAAIDANTGNVVLPPGIWRFDTPLSWTKNSVNLVGSGEGASVIYSTFANGDIITIGDGVANPNNSSVRNLSMTSSVARLSGAAIRLRNGHNLAIERVRLDSNHWWGFQLDGGAQQFMYRVNEFEINSGQVGIIVGEDGTLVQDLNVDDGLIYGAANSGVLLKHMSGGFFSRLDIGSGAGVGFATFAGVGKQVEALYCDRVYCDTMAGSGWSLLTNGGTLSDVTITSGWASSCGTVATDNGFVIDKGAGTIRGVCLIQPRASNNKGSGIRLTSGLDVQIMDPQCGNNSTLTPNTKHGIDVGTNVAEWQVLGGTSGLVGFYGTNTQAYGLFVDTGCTNYTVLGLNVIGNTTGGVSDNSAAATGSISKCPGYITQNTGSAQVTIGNALIAVTHGLAATPLAGEISIVPRSSPSASSVATWWITNIGATTFQISTNAAVAGTALNFEWSARIKGA